MSWAVHNHEWSLQTISRDITIRGYDHYHAIILLVRGVQMQGQGMVHVLWGVFASDIVVTTGRPVVHPRQQMDNLTLQSIFFTRTATVADGPSRRTTTDETH